MASVQCGGQQCFAELADGVCGLSTYGGCKVAFIGFSSVREPFLLDQVPYECVMCVVFCG